MSHVPHELAEEFPDQHDAIHTLKTGNAHFAKLADSYHAVNREIHRIESGVQASAETHETALRKQRMALKDEIAGMLRNA